MKLLAIKLRPSAFRHIRVDVTKAFCKKAINKNPKVIEYFLTKDCTEDMIMLALKKDHAVINELYDKWPEKFTTDLIKNITKAFPCILTYILPYGENRNLINRIKWRKKREK